MSAETAFYIVGLGLAALALIVSFVGLRMENFPPSRGALLAGIGVFVVGVAAAAAFAWQGAEEEQDHRNEEIAAGELRSPAEVMAEYQAAADEAQAEAAGEPAADDGAPTGEVPAGEETASAEGAALFEEQGCAGCHALEAAGSTGTIGPDLDVSLEGTDTAFIEEAIVDPEAEIEEGYPGGVMPDNFEDTLSPEQLSALVDYIAESVGAKG